MMEDMYLDMEKMSKQSFQEFHKEIHLSWERCKDSGLTPQDLPRINTMSDLELNDIMKQNQALIDFALPYMKRIKGIIPPQNSVVLLCNNDCVVLHRLGEAPELVRLGIEKRHIVSENNMGTNCLGTCIAINKPIAIFGSQHFLLVFKEWAGVAAPIHGMDGRVLGALGICMKEKDANYGVLGMVILAVKAIEDQLCLSSKCAELEALNHRLSESNNDIVGAASIVAHEIRNSLSTISAYVQLLQLEKVLDTLKADKILMEVARVNKILNEFKSLTRPSQLQFVRHSLNELLRYVVDLMLAKARIGKVEIKLIMPEQDVYAKVDKEYMQQVFINLIENAIQAMENGGTLTIRLSKDEQFGLALIEFEDTGVGIPEKNLSDIFKPFYTTKRDGSGLGLALCKNIIKNHGGNIRLQSKVGVGTKFTIELPYVE
ncbi:MAG: ATP-binding protein [Caldicoprobacter sp.]|uniref:ATP-binding protein n=1 Tax=Caldicoprobacter sp. TaxID=2004500 RepID=UPI0039C4B06A